MALAPLSPKEAGHLAAAVYLGLETDSAQEVLNRYGNGLNTRWEPGSGTIEGKTGAIIKRTSNFAMVCNAKGGTAKAVAIRGTDFPSGRDWVSNGNVAIDQGVNGHAVHGGFNRVYKSIISEVRAAVAQGSPQTVHVMGHSLGGAIANHVALDLKQRGYDAILYTFGAPRAGMTAYTQDLTQKIGSDNIYRVYDLGDPVPMVPLWPFVHGPIPGEGIKVGGSTGIINPWRHMMADSYMKFMGDHEWTALRRAGRDYESNQNFAYWMEKAGQACNIPGSSWGMWALGKALDLILAAIGGAFWAGFLVSVNVVDKVAYLLSKAVEVAGEIGSWTLAWIKTALRWMGRQVLDSAADVTRAFLRYVLDIFFRALAAAARQALDRIIR